MDIRMAGSVLTCLILLWMWIHVFAEGIKGDQQLFPILNATRNLVLLIILPVLWWFVVVIIYTLPAAMIK